MGAVDQGVTGAAGLVDTSGVKLPKEVCTASQALASDWYDGCYYVIVNAIEFYRGPALAHLAQ